MVTTLKQEGIEDVDPILTFFFLTYNQMLTSEPTKQQTIMFHSNQIKSNHTTTSQVSLSCKHPNVSEVNTSINGTEGCSIQNIYKHYDECNTEIFYCILQTNI